MPYEADGDLNINKYCAYQVNPKPFHYGDSYFEMYGALEGNPKAYAINKAKIDTISRYWSGPVLDIGVGSGEFIKFRQGTYGTDINPVAVKWLQERGLHSNRFQDFFAFSMWDVIEHLHDPGETFEQMPQGSFLFCSLPIFKDLWDVRSSKHYKPDEHLYYFTHDGFIEWMKIHGFRWLETNTALITAGRESILSFAFSK